MRGFGLYRLNQVKCIFANKGANRLFLMRSVKGGDKDHKGGENVERSVHPGFKEASVGGENG